VPSATVAMSDSSSCSQSLSFCNDHHQTIQSSTEYCRDNIITQTANQQDQNKICRSVSRLVAGESVVDRRDKKIPNNKMQLLIFVDSKLNSKL